MATNEQAWKIGFKWTRGDASNEAGAIGVDTTSKALHIADIADIDTDWNVSVDTNPTVYIHSASTPAADYATLDHDATDLTLDIFSANLKIAFDGTDELTLTSSAFSPTTSDGNALGTSSLMWADLFLASGAVINFNNGDITLTHSSNALAFTGGTFSFGTTDTIVLPVKASGGTTSGEFWVDTTDGNIHMYYAGGEYYYSKVTV